MKLERIRPGETIEFDYTNWKGEKSKRRVFVNDFYFGATEYHNNEQWLMAAWDQDKRQHRKFAMADMSNVKIVPVIAKEGVKS